MSATKRFPAKTDAGTCLKQFDTIPLLCQTGTETGKIHAMDQFPPDPFDPATDDGAHNRQVTRDSLFLMADVRVHGEKGVRPVRVRNLSQGGLMAEFPEGLPQGQHVEFDVRGIGWVSGRIAWSAAGRIGVAFDRDIDPMLARKPVGQGAHTPTFVKPIFPRTQR